MDTIGSRVWYSEPTLHGPSVRVGLVTQILPHGRVEIRRQLGGYLVLEPHEILPQPAAPLMPSPRQLDAEQARFDADRELQASGGSARVVFPPAYASYVKAPIHPAAPAHAHKTASKHTSKPPTYAAARAALFAYLRAEGWKLDTSLKIPHATSPDNRTRVWFKAQAVYVHHDDRGRFDFKSARSTWLDIRAITPAQFAKDVQG